MKRVAVVLFALTALILGLVALGAGFAAPTDHTYGVPDLQATVQRNPHLVGRIVSVRGLLVRTGMECQAVGRCGFPRWAIRAHGSCFTPPRCGTALWAAIVDPPYSTRSAVLIVQWPQNVRSYTEPLYITVMRFLLDHIGARAAAQSTTYRVRILTTKVCAQFVHAVPSCIQGIITG